MNEKDLLDLAYKYNYADTELDRKLALTQLKTGVTENIQTLDDAISNLKEQARAHLGIRSGYIDYFIELAEYERSCSIINATLDTTIKENSDTVTLTKKEYQEILKYKEDLEELKRILRK